MTDSIQIEYKIRGSKALQEVTKCTAPNIILPWNQYKIIEDNIFKGRYKLIIYDESNMADFRQLDNILKEKIANYHLNEDQTEYEYVAKLRPLSIPLHQCYMRTLSYLDHKLKNKSILLKPTIAITGLLWRKLTDISSKGTLQYFCKVVKLESAPRRLVYDVDVYDTYETGNCSSKCQ